MGGPGLSFVIVGTPRSGTTLVQRLASEIPGVVVGRETHFFTVFFPGRSTRYPLRGAALRSELEAYAHTPVVAARGIAAHLLARGVAEPVNDPAAFLEALAGLAVPDDAAPDSVILGEKTPGHLLWCPALLAARPGLRVVAVVRDPRAVAASAATMPWGMPNPALAAARWAADEHELRRLESHAPEAVLTLRYEDVVAAPDAAREAVAAHLRTSGRAATPPLDALAAPDESWKAAATGPITGDAIDRWRRELEPPAVAAVERITAGGMRRRGYTAVADAGRRRAALGWRDRRRLLRFGAHRWRERRAVQRLARWLAENQPVSSQP